MAKKRRPPVMRRIGTMYHSKEGRLGLVVRGRRIWRDAKMDASISSIENTIDQNTAGKVQSWKSIDWAEAEEQVSRLQYRIAKAEKEGKHNKVKRLQHLLTNNFYAKCLAVKKVSSNKGARTAGVDGEIWNSPTQKMEAVRRLDNKGYHAKPLRRIYIKKRNGKLRPLSIPCMIDRAMQMLHQMALDPVAEVRLYRHQYGFRIGRRCQDAIGQIFIQCGPWFRPRFVLEGDILGMFDNISHEWLLDNIPMDKRIMKEFLDAGFIFRKKLFPTDLGTPQGSGISPTMANLVMAGLGPCIEDMTKGTRKVHTIIYADDFVVTAPDVDTALKIREGIKPFLAERGLELSSEKTVITEISHGFDFLSVNCMEYPDGKFRTCPSKRSIQDFKDNVKMLLKLNRAETQLETIKELNSKIVGWCNYHKHNVSSKTFKKLDCFLFDQLVRWARRRHPSKSWAWIRKRYWHTVGKDHWVFAAKDEKGELIILRTPTKTGITRYTKVKSEANPYLDRGYFEKRRSDFGIRLRRGSKHFVDPDARSL